MFQKIWSGWKLTFPPASGFHRRHHSWRWVGILRYEPTTWRRKLWAGGIWKAVKLFVLWSHQTILDHLPSGFLYTIEQLAPAVSMQPKLTVIDTVSKITSNNMPTALPPSLHSCTDALFPASQELAPDSFFHYVAASFFSLILLLSINLTSNKSWATT